MRELRRRLKIFLSLFLVLTITGPLGFMFLEGLSFAEALYYNIVTMSTVGYGDIHPTSPASRLFAIFLIMMGGAVFLGVVANATELLIVKREAASRRRKVNMVVSTFFSELLLALQWLDYLEHLKIQYPYLFSLAARKNPFDPDASPIVTD